MLGCIVYILLSGVVCIATCEVCRMIAQEKVKSLGYVSLLKRKQMSFKEVVDNFIPIWSNLKTLLSISSIVEIFSLRDEEWKNVLDKNVNFMKLSSFDKPVERENENQNSTSNVDYLKKDTMNEARKEDTLRDTLVSALTESEISFDSSDSEEKVDSFSSGKVKSKRLYPKIGKK